MNTKISVLSTAIALTSLTFSMNTEAAFLDLFQTTNFVRDTTANGSGVSQDGVGADILGGIRNVSVNLIQDLAPSNLNNGVQIDISGGILSFDNDTNAGGEGRVQWNGTAGFQNLSTTGYNLGLNAYSLGSAFTYETLFLDLTFFDFTVEAYTSATKWTKVTVRTTSVGTEVINFSDLENSLLCGTSFGPILSVQCGGGGNVDFTNLGALQTILNVNGGRVSVDLAIGPISVVPEPSIIGLLGAGLLAIGYTSSTRRRKNGLQA